MYVVCTEIKEERPVLVVTDIFQSLICEPVWQMFPRLTIKTIHLEWGIIGVRPSTKKSVWYMNVEAMLLRL